ncbi:MAG: adenosylcobinamide-GDP ribazoletransferase [Ignavibacteriales bacterium]
MRQGLRWVVHDFILAAQFLTRIPLPFRTSVEADRLAGSARFYPLVGAVLGAILAVTHTLLGSAMPPLPAASMTLAVWVLLTGAIHLDGLMDSADGLLSNRGRERSLEIMKDSRTGPMGVVAAIIVLLAKFSAIASLGGTGAVRALVVAPVAGRLGMVFCLALFPYARGEGMGSFSSKMKASSVVAPSVLAMAVAGLCGPAGLAALVIAVIAAYVASSGVSRFLGGLTGDVYGAACEVSEALALVAWIALRGCL